MTREALYDVALAMAFKYTPATALALWRAAGSGVDVWENRHDIAAIVPGAKGDVAAAVGKLDSLLSAAEKELLYAEEKGIKCLTMADSDYPARLKNCDDAPLVVFYLGNADLNARHIVAVVGTRHCTEYGKSICASFTAGLAAAVPGTLVVSGLAYGIDINAHRGALAAGLPTVAVLAHGLDRIYPAMHRATAAKMVENGGLITEFPTGTNPDKQNFVRRNRIIAGLADATVVVESADKGGSLITASIADSYGREVCAYPGRVSDQYSAGCNNFIRDNKARLITSADDLAKALGWETAKGGRKAKPKEPELFPELNDEERKVYDALTGSDGKQINLLTVETNIPVGQLMSLLFEMEMRGIVKSLNGARYKLNL